MKIERDKDGKTRVAKGDKTGLGGQYAPDPQKLDAAKNKLEELNRTVSTDDDFLASPAKDDPYHDFDYEMDDEVLRCNKCGMNFLGNRENPTCEGWNTFNDERNRKLRESEQERIKKMKLESHGTPTVKTVSLLNGATKNVEFDETGYVCLICGEEYVDNSYGYCDETLECAFDSGEHLIKI